VPLLIADDTEKAHPTKFQHIVNHIFDHTKKREERIVNHIPDHPLTREDLRCLGPGRWLTGEVLDAYMVLLQNRANRLGLRYKFFPTHFFQVLEKEPYTVRNGLQYVKEADALELDKWFIPINQDGNHWVLVIVDFKDERIEMLDPLPNKRELYDQPGIIHRFIADLCVVRHLAMGGDWGSITLTELPTQPDNHNCGVYVILYADVLSTGGPPLWHIPKLLHVRNRIAVDLYTGQVTSAVGT
jgi:Ulp1 family protease